MIWKTDAGATVAFSIQGLLGSTVHGTLAIGSATLDFDPSDPVRGSILVEFPITSLSTGMGLRDSHLMKEEYFDPARFPKAMFRSVSIEKTTDGHFQAKGILQLKGREKPLSIPFTFERDGRKGRFRGSFTINRLDFGVGGRSMNMGDIVTVSIDLPVTTG